MGPVKLGMPKAEAQASAPGRLLYREGEHDHGEHFLAKGLPGLTFSIYDGIIHYITVDSGSTLQTASGIGIGSSINVITKAYGDRVEEYDGESYENRSLEVSQDSNDGLYKQELVFVIEKGRVAEIQVFRYLKYP